MGDKFVIYAGYSSLIWNVAAIMLSKDTEMNIKYALFMPSEIWWKKIYNYWMQCVKKENRSSILVSRWKVYYYRKASKGRFI